MLTMTIEGDLHVGGDVGGSAPEGLPIAINITGALRPFTHSKPERGVFIDGPLIVQGVIHCTGEVAR